jgi:secreted trypsin-like serine protease
VKLKRTRSEVECEFCGKSFMQTRWWQVYCSKKCLKESEKTAKATLKRVLPELGFLRNRVKELENNALDHFQGNQQPQWED